ncbi:MAG TPA: hypothetical protein VKJ45_23930 [Blastocatellia bacterium]|nr:hypothetical protein [Blastocatellia bacterium]
MRFTLFLTVAVLTLAPLARLVYVLATTGENTPSSDDEQFIPFFLDQIMSGGYNWVHFPRDTFQNTHVTMIPALVYVGLAYLDHLNVYHALYLGLLLAGIKLLLVHDAFSISIEKTQRAIRLLLWPVLSWLIFSVCQLSVFEHAFQSLKTGFNEAGLALGIWALVRFKQRWTAILLMGLGGIVASFSFACGLILWPLLLSGMILTGFRKKAQYGALAVAAAVAFAPYADLLYFRKVPGRQSAIASLFNPALLINYLGRPFTNGSGVNYERMAVSEAAGLIGVVLLAAGIWFVWSRRRKATIEQATPALIMTAFSILAGLQIMLYRVQIAPWYVTFAMDFWIGLVGLVVVIWSCRSRSASGVAGGWRHDIAARVWSIAVVAAIIGFYIPANRTRSDKSFFLRTRAPVSAACVRNYGTAPTYCEQTLVPWEVGFSGYLAHLARPLEKHDLSVFAPHREWTLQGDFILDSVRLHEAAASPEIYWSPDRSGAKAEFNDYNHLNLVLAPPNWLSWSISLPAGLESAVFHSAVSLVAVEKPGATDSPVTLSVDIEESGAPVRQVFSFSLGGAENGWHSFSVPLTEYAGKSIILKLSAIGESGGARGLLRYPYIDVAVRDRDDRVASAEVVRPSNTELSAAFTAPGPSDFHLDMADTSKWKAEGLVAAPSADPFAQAWLISDPNPSLEYTGPMDVDLSSCSRFFIRMAASPEIDHRAVRIYYKTDPRQEFNEGMVLVIPLLADGEIHTYTYDLKLTGIRRSRLAGIKIVPVRPPSLSPANQVQIADFGLIRRGEDVR